MQEAVNLRTLVTPGVGILCVLSIYIRIYVYILVLDLHLEFPVSSTLDFHMFSFTVVSQFVGSTTQFPDTLLQLLSYVPWDSLDVWEPWHGSSGSCCFSVMGGAKLANSAAVFGEPWKRFASVSTRAVGTVCFPKPMNINISTNQNHQQFVSVDLI